MATCRQRTLLFPWLYVQTKIPCRNKWRHLQPRQLREPASDWFRRMLDRCMSERLYATMAEFNPSNFHEISSCSSPGGRGEDASNGYWLHGRNFPRRAAECPNPISWLYAAAKLNARSNLTGSKLPYRLRPSLSASAPEDSTGWTKERLYREVYKITPHSRNSVFALFMRED